VKEFLSRERRDFTVRNVDEDDDAYTDLLALGYRTVPVTLIAGRAIKGFDERQLRDALAGAAES
jgi:hypothetical protein